MSCILVRWSLLLLVALALLQGAMTSPLTSRDLAVAEHVDVIPSDEVGLLSEQVFGPELQERGDRDKRALELKLIGGLGAKNYLLNLIFGKINQAIDYKTNLVRILDRTNIQKNLAYGIGGSVSCRMFNKCRTTPRPSTTTEDVPEFNRNGVSLDVPSDAFGVGFSVINNVSEIVGSVIQNSAARTQRFLEALKPYFGKALGIDTTTSIRQRAAVESNLVR